MLTSPCFTFFGRWSGSPGWRLCAVLTKVNSWSSLGQAPPERGARVGILCASQLQFAKINRLMRTVCSDTQIAGRYSNIHGFWLLPFIFVYGCSRIFEVAHSKIDDLALCKAKSCNSIGLILPPVFCSFFWGFVDNSVPFSLHTGFNRSIY